LQAERAILNRPRKGLSAYLDAVDKLRSVEFFFNSKTNYMIRDKVLKQADGLLSKAAEQLENDFHRLLSKCRFGFNVF
jgi:exocyst complex component 7